MGSVLANGNVPVSYMTVPGGFAGTDKTVALMTQLSMGRWGSRSPKIRALALNILAKAKVPEKDYVAEMVAIHNWVRDNIRYTRDVAGQETLLPPEELAFNSKAGDCDDKAMLDAALLGAVGIPTRFVTIGTEPGRFGHVYLHARPKTQWIPLDPIMKDKPAGWEAPAKYVKLRKVFPENIPEEMNMRQQNGLAGPFDWHVGYQGGGFSNSHLSAEPRPGRRGPAPSHVVMDSMLDQDAPMEQISRDLPAFPQQGKTRVQAPTLLQRRPQLIDKRLPPAAVAEQVMAEQQAEEEAQYAAENPMHGLNGPNGLMGPDDLADLSANPGIDRQLPRPDMQRPALAQEPEGIDKMFTRSNQVLRTDRGDRIVYAGMFALNEKPPVRPYNGMAGVPRNGGLPGMGCMPSRSLSGPGLGELADLADEAPAALAPVPSNSSKYLALAAVGLGLYLLLRKKGK